MFETALDGLYCGPAALPGALWQRWNLDPALLLALTALGFMLRRSRAGLAAVAFLAVAFVSPLCGLSAALFSARVVHHVILVALAAPLLALAWPARRVMPPSPALVLSTAVLWGWHLPAAYDLATSNIAVYWAMQLSLLGSALLFWQAVFGCRPWGGPALLGIVAAYVQMGMLGALLTFAPRQLYAIHQAAPLAWGLSPLDDQRLGGLIMWVPAGLAYGLWGAMVARRTWHTLRGVPA